MSPTTGSEPAKAGSHTLLKHPVFAICDVHSSVGPHRCGFY
jgi:hypothetical protein